LGLVFYRYLKSPSILRLIVAGVSIGFVLAVNHTGLLVLPILFLLTVCEVVLDARRIKLFGSLTLIALIGVVVLWSFAVFATTLDRTVSS
jgi:hypothetical protein